MDTKRITAIATLAKVSEQTARQWIEYDWPNTEEHQQWLQTASDKEIADWIQEQA
jgi:bacterioferritin (cytochrome b1)